MNFFTKNTSACSLIKSKVVAVFFTSLLDAQTLITQSDFGV